MNTTDCRLLLALLAVCSIPPAVFGQPTECLTEADCEERMTEGYDKFEVGNFPLSGCFSKDGILYWGTGENFDQSMDLEAFFQSGDVEGVYC